MCCIESFLTEPYHVEDQTVNTKAVLAMRTIGTGRVSLETFTAMMGMLPPVSKSAYSSHNEKIAAAALHSKDASPDEIVNVCVTCDETWSRRGHQAKYGVVVVASWETGLVLDTQILSKFCYECHGKRHMDTTSDEFLDWWEGHQAICGQNY